MFPVLFKIGPLALHTYGLLAAIGIFSGVYLAGRRAEKEGYDRDLAMDLGFTLILSAIIGARLMYVIVEYPSYIDDPLRIFKMWEGGLVFYGGVLTAIPAAIWFLKKHRLDFWTMSDIYAPYLALAHAIGRLGCLAAGCCYGKPTTSWIGITFTSPESIAPRGVPLFPTQLFDSANEFAIFLILLAALPYKKFNGQIMLMWVMLYSVGRFIVEIYRGDSRGNFFGMELSTSQGIATIAFLAGVAMFVWKLKRGGKAKS